MTWKGSFLLTTLILGLPSTYGANEGALSITAYTVGGQTTLDNNTLYTIPSTASVNPLLVCTGERARWLLSNGSEITGVGPLDPFYQRRNSTAASLYRGLYPTALSEGLFVCVGNTTSRGLHITVHLPQGPPRTPTLSEAHERVLVQQGGRVKIRCDVEKHVSPYPTLSWIKDGHTLHTDGSVNTTLGSSLYRSEFSMFLEISPFTPSDRGTYQCTSTNGLGTVHSKQVYLDLKGVPAVYSAHQIVYYDPEEGEELVIAANASQYHTLLWFHNGVAIATENTEKYKTENFGQTLRVTMATYEDRGNYSISATTNENCREGGANCRVGGVNIQAIPYSEVGCSIKEENPTLYTGSHLQLSCDIRGYPIPTVIWFHNGTKLHDSHVTSSKGKSVLYLNDITMETSGSYTCRVQHTNPLTLSTSTRNSTREVTVKTTSKPIVIQVLLDLPNCQQHQVQDVITGVGNSLRATSVDAFEIVTALFVCSSVGKGVYRGEVLPVAMDVESKAILQKHFKNLLSSGITVAIGNTMATSQTSCQATVTSLSSPLCAEAVSEPTTEEHSVIMMVSLATVSAVLVVTMVTIIISCICVAIRKRRLLKRELQKFGSVPHLQVTNPYTRPPCSRRPSPCQIHPDDNIYQTINPNVGRRSRSHSPLPSSSAKPVNSSGGVYHYAECSLMPKKIPKPTHTSIGGCGREEYVAMKGCGKEEYVTMKGCGKEEYVTIKGCGKEEYVTMKGCGKEEYVAMKGCGKEEYVIMNDRFKKP